MMIRFDLPDSGIVMINPDLVTKVGKHHMNEEAALIYFGKDDFTAVAGTIEDVGNRVASAQRR